MKVGADVAMDQRRLALIRSIIDDPKECAGRPTPSLESLVGKQAGPTGSVLMIDSNQVWEYVTSLTSPCAPERSLTRAGFRIFAVCKRRSTMSSSLRTLARGSLRSRLLR